MKQDMLPLIDQWKQEINRPQQEHLACQQPQSLFSGDYEKQKAVRKEALRNSYLCTAPLLAEAAGKYLKASDIPSDARAPTLYGENRSGRALGLSIFVATGQKLKILIG